MPTASLSPLPAALINDVYRHAFPSSCAMLNDAHALVGSSLTVMPLGVMTGLSVVPSTRRVTDHNDKYHLVQSSTS